ncbi:MAG: fatty acid desaturase [Gammaproteobacteria bacterium]
MHKFLVNIRYLETPILIFATLVGLVIGGPWVWTGVVLLIASIIIDWFTSVSSAFHADPAGRDDNGDLYGIASFLKVMMWIQYPVFVMLQLALVWRAYEFATGVPFGPNEIMGITIHHGLTTLGMVGATISAGIYMGLGIMFGHELAHTKGPTFVLARWMMALSGIAHFCYAHVYNHHLELGCEDDPATSPRGRNIYKHYLLSHFGQSRFLYVMEQQRLKKRGIPFISWQNRWIRGYAMSLPTIFIFWFAAGWIGLAVMVGSWVISAFELEVLNYLEHYGLIREKGQPIDYHHSWDVGESPFTQFGFIEIGRQADHHDRGETHFWELEECDAPDTGYGYYAMLAMLMVPPVWESFIKPRLADWDENRASEAERKIAARMNYLAGWHDMPLCDKPK